MNLILPPPPPPAPGLILHAGGESVSRADAYAVETPASTGTWYPLPHRSLIEEVQSELKSCGFLLDGESHALSHGGARYFGTFAVSLPSRPDSDFGWVVGLRNSHDKSWPAGLVAGTRVWVCDNTAFTGEVRLSRKHTKHAVRDLRQLMARAVGQLGTRFRKLDERVAAYRQLPFDDRNAHHFIIHAIDSQVITPTQVPSVLKEWRQPKHEAFQPRTLWSMFNAISEIHKRSNPHALLRRGEALYGLADAVVGLAHEFSPNALRGHAGPIPGIESAR